MQLRPLSGKCQPDVQLNLQRINQLQNNDLPHPNSDTGTARNPLLSGKLLGVREMTAPPPTRDLPTTVRTKLRFTVSPSPGSSVHFASKRSSRPPTSTTATFSSRLSRPACSWLPQINFCTAESKTEFVIECAQASARALYGYSDVSATFPQHVAK